MSYQEMSAARLLEETIEESEDRIRTAETAAEDVVVSNDEDEMKLYWAVTQSADAEEQA